MTVDNIRELLDAELVCGKEYLNSEVHTACGSDMISDVLAFVKDQAVLLTGLVNPQVIRTAEMMDMLCVVFVRGKEPGETIIELAEEKGICVLRTALPMFSACGILYDNGLRGGHE